MKHVMMIISDHTVMDPNSRSIEVNKEGHF